MILAASQGISHGNLNLADIFYLVAAIIFFVAAFIYLQLNPKPLSHILVAIGLGLVALGLFVT